MIFQKNVWTWTFTCTSVCACTSGQGGHGGHGGLSSYWCFNYWAEVFSTAHLRGALSTEASASASETEGWVKDEKKANRTAVKDSTAMMEMRMKTCDAPQWLWWIWHLGLCDHICSGCFSFLIIRPDQGAPPPNLGPTQPEPAVSQGPAPAPEPPSHMIVISVRSPDYMKVGHLRDHLHENMSKQDFLFSFGHKKKNI